MKISAPVWNVTVFIFGRLLGRQMTKIHLYKYFKGCGYIFPSGETYLELLRKQKKLMWFRMDLFLVTIMKYEVIEFTKLK